MICRLCDLLDRAQQIIRQQAELLSMHGVETDGKALGCACALTGRSTKTPGGGFLSSVAFVGILKKAVIMLVVLLSVQLDGVIGDKTMFQSAAIFFYIANEGLSILENCALMDVPVPKPLRDALEALKNKGNDAGQSDDGGDENP